MSSSYHNESLISQWAAHITLILQWAAHITISRSYHKELLLLIYWASCSYYTPSFSYYTELRTIADLLTASQVANPTSPPGISFRFPTRNWWFPCLICFAHPNCLASQSGNWPPLGYKLLAPPHVYNWLYCVRPRSAYGTALSGVSGFYAPHQWRPLLLLPLLLTPTFPLRMPLVAVGGRFAWRWGLVRLVTGGPRELLGCIEQIGKSNPAQLHCCQQNNFFVV